MFAAAIVQIISQENVRTLWYSAVLPGIQTLMMQDSGSTLLSVKEMFFLNITACQRSPLQVPTLATNFLLLELTILLNQIMAQQSTLPASKTLLHPPQRSSRQTRVSSNCLLSVVAFLLLTANTAASAYHSRHQPSALGFALFCYVDLALLFLCLKSFERLGPDSPAEKKEGLKAATWLLATALTLAFSWRVAEVMPLLLAVAVWVMAGSVAVGGFYFLFLYSDEADDNLGQDYCIVGTKECPAEEKV
ncbi:hypothetical protein Cni_G22911 [Canna indica]|uniref:Uncharacterized protein n=1 Tax=Canna indica TaxID=4628 RepID=A0AAQ3QM01_9LILI|nr:hypothetical protein Cni_G22911 [Canna indica]